MEERMNRLFNLVFQDFLVTIHESRFDVTKFKLPLLPSWDSTSSWDKATSNWFVIMDSCLDKLNRAPYLPIKGLWHCFLNSSISTKEMLFWKALILTTAYLNIVIRFCLLFMWCVWCDTSQVSYTKQFDLAYNIYENISLSCCFFRRDIGRSDIRSITICLLKKQRINHTMSSLFTQYFSCCFHNTL